MFIGRMRTFVEAGACALILAGLLAPAAFGQGGSITVGTKVIYPGGADQPPKEKDTGVTFKVGNIHGAVGRETVYEVSYEQDAAWQDLLDDGKAEDLVKALRGKTDPLARTYRVLAYQELGQTSSARREAERALRDPEFPEDLRTRIENALPPPAVTPEETPPNP